MQLMQSIGMNADVNNRFKVNENGNRSDIKQELGIFPAIPCLTRKGKMVKSDWMSKTDFGSFLKTKLFIYGK